MRFKATTLIVSFLCAFALAEAQSTGLGTDISAIPKIIPPSPNAAALEKFTTIPVDYSTGVPSISYPMWSWKRGKLSFNLGLSYHAGGNKVDDMAPTTGLGWALTGIGRISRTVKGIADDDFVKGFMYTDPIPEFSTYAYDPTAFYFTSCILEMQQQVLANIALTQYNSPYSNVARQIIENEIDGEQDIFSYSFNGMSGRFIIDKNRNIIPLEHTNSKIEMTCNPTTLPADYTTGRIIAFKITDDKGVVYKFEHLEQQTSQPYSDVAVVPAPPPQSYTSGWLLTQITDPYTQDAIVISYVDNGDNVSYETGFSESQSYRLSYADYSTGLVVESPAVESSTFSFNLITTNEPQPVSVLFPDSSLLTFEYNQSRLDLLHSKPLTKVLVQNYQSSIVKRFDLDYTYFESGSGAFYPLGYDISGNDFNKRLCLNKISEVSADGTIFKPTQFTYNSTIINPRGSKNLDYWGYNVNPARNNPYYVPAVPIADPEKPDFIYQANLEGANRKPDETYVKAGVLEKIQYPTGGSTFFEYESNKAYSAVNYYEDRLSSNTDDWSQGDFGNAHSITFSGRTRTSVEFVFQTQELSARPEPDPNDPQACLAESQDNMTARFEVTSTDNMFSTYVEDVYSHFLGLGKKIVIDLPINKNYTVKFIYNSSQSCAFIFPFKATTSAGYYIAPQDKPAGGLRIHKITWNDGTGTALTKEYDYNGDDGHTSATLTTVPDFGYYRTGLDAILNCPHDTPQPTRHLHRTSNPTNTLNFFNGSPLIYKAVKEKETDGSYVERHYDDITWAANGSPIDQYPYMPIQDFPNLSGLMIKQIIKDKDGVIKQEQNLTYNKSQSYLVGQATNRNMKAGTIASALTYPAKYYIAQQYFMYTSHAELTDEETKSYEAGNVLTTSKSKTYDPDKLYVRTETTTNSKNETRLKQFSYSFDETGTTYDAMRAGNILSEVTGTVISDPNISNGELSRVKTGFQVFQGPMPSLVQDAFGGNSLRLQASFDSYDEKGNLLQYTGRDGVVTSILWGYHKQYPVAKISGMSYSNAVSQSGINLAVLERPANDNALRTELNKLRTLPNCLINSLTYLPLIGTTSETDPSGKVIYYEYDGFGRLKLVRDKDGNIIKTFDYHYQAQ